MFFFAYLIKSRPHGLKVGVQSNYTTSFPGLVLPRPSTSVNNLLLASFRMLNTFISFLISVTSFKLPQSPWRGHLCLPTPMGTAQRICHDLCSWVSMVTVKETGRHGTKNVMILMFTRYRSKCSTCIDLLNPQDNLWCQHSYCSTWHWRSRGRSA